MAGGTTIATLIVDGGDEGCIVGQVALVVTGGALGTAGDFA